MNRLKIEQKAADMTKIAEYYGLESRLDILQEECAELIQAISKFRRTRDWNSETPVISNAYVEARTNLSEEMADVLNLLVQSSYLLRNENLMEFWWDHKLKRTADIMKKERALNENT